MKITNIAFIMFLLGFTSAAFADVNDISQKSNSKSNSSLDLSALTNNSNSQSVSNNSSQENVNNSQSQAINNDLQNVDNKNSQNNQNSIPNTQNQILQTGNQQQNQISTQNQQNVQNLTSQNLQNNINNNSDAINQQQNPIESNSAAAANQNQNNVTNSDSTNQSSIDAMKESAFDSMTQNMLPMTNDQIRKLRRLFDRSQYAASALPTTPSKAIISSQYVSLAPGTTPPVVRLQQGMVSVLSFIDSTGEPWPIQSYDIGNPTVFNIQWNKSDNILMFQPNVPYAYGNIAVLLQGSSTPIILTLVTGQSAFDARLDLHMQAKGPNALPVVGNTMPTGTSATLLAVLDGVPPQNSMELQTANDQVRAWLDNDKILVRTRYTLISPAWLSTISSSDSMRAYEIPKTSMLLISDNGKLSEVKLTGF